MGKTPSRIPVGGIWYRYAYPGVDPVAVPPPTQAGRWQRGSAVGAIYLADEPDTVWAEFYRAAAERRHRPGELMPCELWRYHVALADVADVTDPRTIAELRLPAGLPDTCQWSAYQAVGEQFAKDGAQGVLYQSAARPGHHCLCVFAGGLGMLSPTGRERIEEPPIPPRGMRT